MLQSKRQIYRVVYDRVTPSWTIEMDGRARPLTRVIAKADAIELAIKLGRSAEVGQVFVHCRDGSVETEHKFGEITRDGARMAS